MRNRIKRLQILAPAIFEETIGYKGDADWLGIYLESQINQTICDDGKGVRIKCLEFWEIICDCLISNSSLDFGSIPKHSCLLLNRKTRILYSGEQSVIERYLQQTACLDLLAAFQQEQEAEIYPSSQFAANDAPARAKAQQAWLKTNTFVAQVIKGATVVGVAATFLVVAATRLPKSRYELKLFSPHQATILKAAYNPTPANLINATQALIDPSLPSVEAMIITDNRLSPSAQVEWHFLMKRVDLIYKICGLSMLLGSIILIFHNKDKGYFYFQILLFLPSVCIAINLISALALTSSTLAAVLFLEIIVSLMTWGIVSSVESIIVDLINTRATLNFRGRRKP